MIIKTKLLISIPCKHVNLLLIYMHYVHLLDLQSNPKQPSCKKVCGPQKGYGEKRCEIQGGGQEMAVMVG